MCNTEVKKIRLGSILREAFEYCNKTPKMVLLFVVLNYMLCSAMVYSWKTFWLWALLLVMYVLWGGLFRYYFERKPYFEYSVLFYSMIPSTKIVVLSVIVVSLIFLFPVMILFIPNLPDAFAANYAHFLKVTMQQTDILDAVVNLVVVLFSPVILYRPMLAWIAALLGRSGSLRFAWEKTQGNYWEFLLLAIIINLSVAFLYNGILWIGGNIYIALVPISVLVVYFNIVIAKLYEHFFLDI